MNDQHAPALAASLDDSLGSSSVALADARDARGQDVPTLTKAELAEMLFEQVGLNKRESKDMVEAFFDVIREALEHPQVSARNLLVSSSMHQGPHFQAVGPAFGIHQKDASPSSTAPKLGEDTRSILTEGGFTAAEIELFLNTKAAFAPLP